ncbi:MAG: 16S rRNA (adenine(1518)-N(6)/adenine(1519)-N(6))-dimethyltransferase RsmA [Lachnospiraceae bacterium]|nr:16S rRNA (adenine(1518)-N(6)/adenine(1519)-N(6))-dimethyltransferase RsmA [Lachnospiraceae bacterium]
MSNPDSISGTLEIIDKYGFDFQKRFGQNFLIDANIVEKIVTGSGVTKEDTVLEIGPGIGTMTRHLCERAKKVIAVEIDKALIPILKDTLSEYDNVVIINEDILKIDLNELIETYAGKEGIKVVANLPYYITTPIIMGLFESKADIKSITVMIQKEVADRMCKGPGSKDYGALSLAVQYYSKPEMIALVSPGCFIPRPKVGSSVIRLERYKEPPVRVKSEKLMFDVIKAAFSQRRKTLANCLSHYPELGINREKTVEMLEKMGLDGSIRGERLTLTQFGELSDMICEIKR